MVASVESENYNKILEVIEYEKDYIYMFINRFGNYIHIILENTIIILL